MQVRRRELVFVYAEQYRGAGSTVMRGRQLSELSARHLGRRVRYAPLGSRIARSDVFLTKGAARAMTMPILEELRNLGNRLFVDVVDEEPPNYVDGYVDALVAASYSSLLRLSRDFPRLPVGLVNHHVDPRVPLRAPESLPDRFAVGYLGESVNALIPDEVSDRVEVVHIDTSSSEGTDWIGRLGDFTMHYAVRNTRDLDHDKPFLKGFTAAWSGANILIQRSQVEAGYWLGADYPFLVDGDDPASISAALDAAAGAFGAPLWHDALRRMLEIRERIRPERIANEVAALLALP
ncbi:hypothetical protein ET445_15845 [Agromyces protaetiae]|uniref:Glycosyltransferase family 1 protein n=1 Tax=Agromyces protaetiae TaxID=2509455 RepID=A0A4P6FKR0_9MICO|nr:hypothetical protein [Agromyces protaetiae]QAY74587.1 hypothetical protein ET445_15845 [Agromyces protaetiae]